MNGFYAAPTDLSLNTAIGLGALAATPSYGGDNTAIGYNALNANTGNGGDAAHGREENLGVACSAKGG